MKYIAKLKKQGKHWLAEFPDCPGCQTFGDSKAEAIAMAKDALFGWLETSLDHGAVPPYPKYEGSGATAVIAIDDPSLAFALQLRWMRAKHGLSQAQLAKRAGVSQQQIAKLESPKANPTLQTIKAIAVALGATFEPQLA